MTREHQLFKTAHLPAARRMFVRRTRYDPSYGSNALEIYAVDSVMRYSTVSHCFSGVFWNANKENKKGHYTSSEEGRSSCLPSFLSSTQRVSIFFFQLF